jgi:hypothetical protein
MSKRGNRGSISVSRSAYLRMKAHCDREGISMSQFVEALAESLAVPDAVALEGVRR